MGFRLSLMPGAGQTLRRLFRRLALPRYYGRAVSTANIGFDLDGGSTDTMGFYCAGENFTMLLPRR